MNIIVNKPGVVYSDLQMVDIAGLIYDTDPYIYPAMFSSREEAISIIPKMFGDNDNMFNIDNLFSVSNNGVIVGVILWHRGPMEWSDIVYRAHGGNSPYIEDLRINYFSEYNKTPSGTVSIINVCTSVHGKGIGSKMLGSFMNEVKGPYELFVLADNIFAVNLYKKNGFVIASEGQGYSVDKQHLPCYRMVKEIVYL